MQGDAPDFDGNRIDSNSPESIPVYSFDGVLIHPQIENIPLEGRVSRMPTIDWSKIEEVTQEDLDRISITCDEGIVISEEIDLDIRKTIAEIIKCMQLEAWDPKINICSSDDCSCPKIIRTANRVTLQLPDYLIDFSKMGSYHVEKELINTVSRINLFNPNIEKGPNFYQEIDTHIVNYENLCLKYYRDLCLAHELYHIRQTNYSPEYIEESFRENVLGGLHYLFSQGEMSAEAVGIRYLVEKKKKLNSTIDIGLIKGLIAEKKMYLQRRSILKLNRFEE